MTFTSENQPENRKKRGKSFKNKLLDVIREESMINVTPGASLETAEKAFIKTLARRAFSEDDAQGLTLLRELLSKSYPTLKSTMDTFTFDLKEDSTPAEKAAAILSAIAQGEIPPDVGSTLIQAAKNMIDIELATDLKERIEALEKLYDSSGEET